MIENVETYQLKIGCPDCDTEFETEVQYFFDNDSLPEDRKLGRVKCPNCGAEYTVPLTFFYLDYERNTFFVIFDEHYYSSFGRLKLICEREISSFMQKSAFDLQKIMKKAQIQYIERDQFEGISGRGKLIRITPTPSIVIDDEYCFLGEEKRFNIARNDIVFDATGISSSQKKFISAIENRLLRDGFPMSFRNSPTEQKPAVTCGFLSIVLTIGSVIILPVLINVISNLISEELISEENRKQKSNKNENQENLISKKDTLSVTICENNSDRVFHFEGRAEDVATAMKACSKSAMKTISIKDTHTANVIDNVVYDLLTHDPKVYTFSEMASKYQKQFDAFSAVEFEYNKDFDEPRICYKASLLYEAKEYKAAYWILRPWIDKATTIEFFYNFALCISKLQADSSLLVDVYFDVVRKYMNSPDLVDMKSFGGINTQSDLDAIDEKFVEEGIIAKDEDGNVVFPSPKEEEMKSLAEGHNILMDIIRKDQNIDIELLKKEAELNSIEAGLLEEQKENNKELKQLMEEVSEGALKEVEIVRKYREEKGISDEEFLEMLISDQQEKLFNEAIPNRKDNDKTEERQRRFDELYKHKHFLEFALEKIKADREEILIKQRNGEPK